MIPLIVAGVAALDQYTKTLARREGLAILNRRGSIPPLGTRTAWAVFVILSSALCMLVVLGPPLAVATRVGFGLACGGALGNLVDRARLGGVTDFIRIGRWPAFNLADAAMTAAVLLCAWEVFSR